MAFAKKKIRFVDGFAIRNVFPDMDVVESWSTTGGWRGDVPTPFVPEDEIWVDRRFRKEKAFLLEVHRIEQLKRHWPYYKVREYLKERLCRKGPMPQHVVRSRRHGKLTIRFVRGEIVRRYLDPCFIFGGHDLVYDYIPKNEVWIDVRQDPREVKYTLLHELHERRRMAKGWTYGKAHASATQAELRERKRLTAPKRARPLRLKPFRQIAGYCGPASMKIVCAHFGRDYAEKALGDMCGTTAEEGTDHSGLIAGAKAVGAAVYAKSGGTLADLRRFTAKHRLPVIVGWYSPSNQRKVKYDPDKDEMEDHFSVVYHVSTTHVYLMDPETESGRKKIRIGRFLKLWWDTDGPKCKRVDRWFMVMSFDGKTF